MRVVSQKQDYSVDFDRTPFWTQGRCIYAVIGDQRIVFGVYESEERTGEVFRDMHSKYGIVETCKNRKGLISIDGYICYMPEV